MRERTGRLIRPGNGVIMRNSVISEEELANAEKLCGRGDFNTALSLTEGMLSLRP